MYTHTYTYLFTYTHTYIYTYTYHVTGVKGMTSVVGADRGGYGYGINEFLVVLIGTILGCKNVDGSSQALT